ncbi:tRNA lysidine(34) synthetase TilS [Streptomyces sp. OF3]|uniref:tRNA(Ile)-lysidine synthase n=1 Tax=Streptomyces alkaliterrae TaxID=2213162 RepID=A0A7W3WIU1_9ACTN|nr:tRNA lysidine(34) synthetase TilS [Streptomyces alkaliterrae]MBB1252675.1 tRNA lysidine(34) synthetase TilS [Streptomyces alkaliterrae]
MGPHPAVAAIRLAVRRVLHDVLDEALTRSPDHARRPSVRRPGEPTGERAGQRPGAAGTPLVLAACSGGADSMALASALAFEAPRLGLRAGGVTVDHGLQAGSAERAAEVAERLTAMGLEPVEAVTVTVGRGAGPEAAARAARYAALDAVAERAGAAAVLLGHTRDDQAETVLLGLARGSGTRSLAGMAAVTGSGAAPAPLGPLGGPADGSSADPAAGPASRRYRRPFLAIDRQTTRRACMVQSLPVWDDPHNTDPAYTRSRVRHEAMPILEKALGKGVIEALARTAQLARDDADALDAWAADAERSVRVPFQGDRLTRDAESAPGSAVLDVNRLYALPPAVRRRVLRRAVLAAGAPAGSLFARHIEEADRLITAWRGQKPLNLPGRVEVRRRGGTLVIRQSDI